MHQNELAHASVQDGDWKLVAHGDVFSEKPEVPLKLELYNLKQDPHEADNIAADHPDITENLEKSLHEFGALQKPGGHSYDFSREGFKAPKDWIVEP